MFHQDELCTAELRPVAPVAGVPDVSLAEALTMVEKYFDLPSICDRRIEADQIVEYYRQSERAYRMFHSHQGAMHIGLTATGRDATEGGHARHVAIVAEQVDAIGAETVIEFGCGAGYNVRTLSQQMPNRQFLGVDLSARHIRLARNDAQGATNLRFAVANYEQLPDRDASFDLVLAVESLCQTGDQSRALAEAYRVLKPGGRMVVLDCFRNVPLDLLPSDLKLAAVLVEKTAAVDAFDYLDAWRRRAVEIGFQTICQTDHSAETAADLRRLYRLARRFFNMSLAVRMIRRAMPPLAMENSVCGLLMPYTVGSGSHGYYSIVLQKPSRSESGPGAPRT